MKTVSIVAIVAALAAGPAFAQCGGSKMQSAQDETLQSGSFELAQTRGEGRTLREQENRRSGGTGVAPAPNTVKGGGDSADDGKPGTSTATNPDTNTGVQGGSGRSDTTKGPKIKSQSGSDGDNGGSSGR
jgi:hypothetical protein